MCGRRAAGGATLGWLSCPFRCLRGVSGCARPYEPRLGVTGEPLRPKLGMNDRAGCICLEEGRLGASLYSARERGPTGTPHRGHTAFPQSPCSPHDTYAPCPCPGFISLGLPVSSPARSSTATELPGPGVDHSTYTRNRLHARPERQGVWWWVVWRRVLWRHPQQRRRPDHHLGRHCAQGDYVVFDAGQTRLGWAWVRGLGEGRQAGPRTPGWARGVKPRGVRLGKRRQGLAQAPRRHQAVVPRLALTRTATGQRPG